LNNLIQVKFFQKKQSNRRLGAKGQPTSLL
jgi:hypothetical protein